MVNQNDYQKVVPFILFVLALFLLFALVKPMITVILGSILIAYLAFPLYARINKKVNNKHLAIILSLLIVATVIAIPFSFLAFELTQQGYYFYNSLSSNIDKGALFGYGCTSAESRVCSLINRAENFSLNRLSTLGVDKQLENLLPILQEKITGFMLIIPFILAKIFLTLVIAFFILQKWELILIKLIDLLPMREETVNQLITQFSDITYTVIYSQLFVALTQGIIGAIGFYFLGVPFPIILGAIMAFCALLPTVGTALVWVPASMFLLVSGYFSNDNMIVAKGIFLLIYGILIISTIDNILLAKIVHAKTKVSQIVVIIGVIGGASLFGVIGIFVGPILLPLLITYFQSFKDRFK